MLGRAAFSSRRSDQGEPRAHLEHPGPLPRLPPSSFPLPWGGCSSGNEWGSPPLCC